MRVKEKVKIYKKDGQIKIEGSTIEGSVSITDENIAFMYSGGTALATVDVRISNETEDKSNGN